MKVNIQAVNFTIHEPLTEFVEERLGKLELFYENIIKANVYLKLENTSDKENKIAEVLLEIPGDDVVAKKISTSFEESIAQTVDALKRQLIKRKESIK